MSRPSSASSIHTSDQSIRWGIAGTGKIAHDFCIAVRQLSDVRLVAVGSREFDTANQFADQFNITQRFGSYEELAACSDVDVVYVCTPNSRHLDVSKMMLLHGRAVVCEKPFTVNRREAEELVEIARQQGVFLMEGMWTRFIPSMQKVRELLRANTIGEVRYVSAHIGFSADSMLDTAKKNKELHDRIHKTELGGGAILDVGSYGVSFASWVLGPGAPTEVTALAHVDEKDGVDVCGTFSLRYGKEAFAQILYSSRFNTCDTAMIMGNKGYIELAAPWQVSDHVTLHLKDKPPQTFHFPLQESEGEYDYPHCSLFQYEASHVHECLRSKKVESPLMPWAESCEVMKTLDHLRQLIGVRLENDDENNPSKEATELRRVEQSGKIFMRH